MTEENELNEIYKSALNEHKERAQKIDGDVRQSLKGAEVNVYLAAVSRNEVMVVVYKPKDEKSKFDEEMQKFVRSAVKGCSRREETGGNCKKYVFSATDGRSGENLQSQIYRQLIEGKKSTPFERVGMKIRPYILPAQM
jgi:hypothetical protein